MEEREEWSGEGGGDGAGGGDWGNYTQADSICFSSVFKHPPPLQHSYFQTPAFPDRTDAGGEQPHLPHLPPPPINPHIFTDEHVPHASDRELKCKKPTVVWVPDSFNDAG